MKEIGGSDNKPNLRSEEVQDILNLVPHRLIRWGNTFILILIIGSFIISWYIKYPDSIYSEIIITTIVPPEKVIANKTGQIESILVHDNEEVEKNEIIAVLQNSANYKDVLRLIKVIDSLSIDYDNFYFPLEKLPMLYLGSVEDSYSVFKRSYIEYNLNKQLEPFSSELLANRLSITEAKNRLQLLINQQKLNEDELLLNKRDLERSQKLFQKGVISKQEFERKQIQFLQMESSYNNIISSISQLRDFINSSSHNLNDTEIRKTQTNSRITIDLIQSYEKLKISLKNWELNNALQASIDGKVAFLSYWSENQHVKEGEHIFSIIPKNGNTYIGKIQAPAKNSGKIKIGQKVNIRLKNYPYNEFGMLEGFVQKISLVPDANGEYLIDIKLPDHLVTTYQKNIEFKQEMRGTGIIITEDLRLIERLFYGIRYIFNK